MASVMVDGLRVPLPVAGRPALDFLNTRAGLADADQRVPAHLPALGGVGARARAGRRGAVPAVAGRRPPRPGARRGRTAAGDVPARGAAAGAGRRAGHAGHDARRMAGGPSRGGGRARRGELVPVTDDAAADGLAPATTRTTASPRGGCGEATDAVLVPYAELVLDVAAAAHRAGRAARAGVPDARLRLGVRRPERTAALVLDGVVRQPVQGPPPPRPIKGAATAGTYGGVPSRNSRLPARRSVQGQ